MEPVIYDLLINYNWKKRNAPAAGAQWERGEREFETNPSSKEKQLQTLLNSSISTILYIDLKYADLICYFEGFFFFLKDHLAKH